MAKSKNYFEGVDTLEELKKMYHNYVLMYHPDKHRKERETYTEIMATINAQYDKLFAKVKNKHQGFDKSKCQYYTYTKETEENVNDFKDVINALVKLRKVKVELIGSWIWVSGETKSHKDKLTELGLHYAPQKQAWQFHTGKYTRKSKSKTSLNDLRAKYVSVEFEGNNEESLALAN
jgi:curved DNA-binding protein CbpA